MEECDRATLEQWQKRAQTLHDAVCDNDNRVAVCVSHTDAIGSQFSICGGLAVAFVEAHGPETLGAVARMAAMEELSASLSSYELGNACKDALARFSVRIADQAATEPEPAEAEQAEEVGA